MSLLSAWLLKAAQPFIIVLLLILAALFLGWLTVKTVNGMVDDAVTRTVSERDAFWSAGIEAANKKAAEAEANQARYALNLERDTNVKLDALRTQKKEREIKNARLPNGDRCGLGRDRVRLLSH